MSSITPLTFLQSISKLKKKNFDLKLELFHRRQRADTLEGQLREKDGAIEILEEQAATFESERAEALRLQEELLRELERRDEAVAEAVAMILKLETEVKRLSGRGGDRGSASSEGRARQESTTSHASAGPPASALSRSKWSQIETACTAKNSSNESAQQSSILRRDLGSSRALRSLYAFDDQSGSLSYNLSQGPLSVTSGEDDIDAPTVDRDIVRSPSLSVLSESSFLSVYGRSELSDAYGDTSLRPRSPNQDGFDMASLDRDLGLLRSSPPITRNSSAAGKQSVKAQGTDSVGSIGQLLESAPRSRAARPQIHDEPKPMSAPRLPKPSLRDHAPSFGGPIFGTPALPPTPDTLGTVPSTAHSSAHSVVAERSQAEATLPDRLQSLLPSTGFAQAHPRHVLDNALDNALDPHDDTWSSDGDSLPSLRPAYQRKPAEGTQRVFATSHKALRTVGLNPYERSRYGTSPPFREPSGAPSTSSAASSAGPPPRARRASVDPAALPADRPAFGPRKLSERTHRAPPDIATPPRERPERRLAAARSLSHTSKSSRGTDDPEPPRPDSVAQRLSPAKCDAPAAARPTLAARILRRGSHQPTAAAPVSSPSTPGSPTPCATPKDAKHVDLAAAAAASIPAEAHRAENHPPLARSTSARPSPPPPPPPPHRRLLPPRAQSIAFRGPPAVGAGAGRRPGTAGSLNDAAPAPPAIRRARPAARVVGARRRRRPAGGAAAAGPAAAGHAEHGGVGAGRGRRGGRAGRAGGGRGRGGDEGRREAVALRDRRGERPGAGRVDVAAGEEGGEGRDAGDGGGSGR